MTPHEVQPRAPSIGGELMASALELALFGNVPTPVRLGRFVIVDRIAAGGMGVVYRAFDPDLGRPVAIKVLAAGREHLTERMRREAQILARLNHPNIVTVYETGVDQGRVYVAMELVVGGTLRDWCERNPPGTRARFERLLALTIQAARGLMTAHDAGLIHRDLKPTNLLVDAEERLRIADFGLARLADAAEGSTHPTRSEPSDVVAPDDPLTASGEVLGTPAYMPPEQFAGKSDGRSDQFSLCATFWEAAYAERHAELEREPGDGPSPRRADVPAWYRDVLRRGLATDPALRHRDVRALLAELERRRDRAGRVVGALGIVAVAAAIAVGLARREPESPCVTTRAGLDEVWSTTNPERASLPASVVERLDDFSGAWRSAVFGTCEAARARGELQHDADPLELPSRSMACYRHARTELAAVVERLGMRMSEPYARSVVRALPMLARCEGLAGDGAEDLGEGRPIAESIARAGVAIQLHDYDEVRRRLAELEPVVSEQDQPALAAEVAMLETMIAARVQDRPAQYAAAMRALARAEAAGDPALLGQAWLYFADATRAQGNLELTTFALERAASVIRAAGSPAWLVANLRGNEGRAASARGDHRKAYELGKLQLEFLRVHGTALGVASRAHTVSLSALPAGDAAGALALSQEAVAGCTLELGDDHPETARAKAWNGALLLMRGDEKGALPLLQSSADTLAKASDVPPSDRVAAQINLASLLRDLRRFDDARAAVARGRSMLAAVPDGRASRLGLDSAEGSIELDAGNNEAAIRLLEDAWRQFGELRTDANRDDGTPIAANLADAYANVGRNAEAGAVADGIIADLALLASDQSAVRGSSLCAAGDIYRRIGRVPEARAAYRDALVELGREGANPKDAAEVHLGLAELLLDDGDLVGARVELALAEGAAPPRDRLQARFDAAKRRLADP